MTLWDHCCCVGYGLSARFTAVGHLLRGHRLHWRDNIDLWAGCTGDIWCEHCADCSLDEQGQRHSLSIWVRDWAWLRWVAQQICGLSGHAERRHPRKWNGQGDAGDEANQVDVEDQWYCFRCVADVPPPSVDAVGQRRD